MRSLKATCFHVSVRVANVTDLIEKEFPRIGETSTVHDICGLYQICEVVSKTGWLGHTGIDGPFPLSPLS